MMNNDPPSVQEPPREWGPDAWPDPRVARSMRAVEVAMAELLPDVGWRELTVQQILDRAGVSRGTFYKHYRNKDDALRASLGGMLSILQRTPALGSRLFPVRELLDHVAGAAALESSLGAANRLEQLWDEMREELALRLTAQLEPLPGSFDQAPVLAGRVLAGAMVELVRFARATDTPVSSSTLDDRFHRVAATTIGAFGCVRRT